MSYIIPIRPAVQRDVRIIRKADSALLVDAATNQMVLCDWEEIAEFVAEPSPLVYPGNHRRVTGLEALEDLFPRIATNPAGRQPVSLLIVKITSYCPLRCTYCYDYEEVDPVKVDAEALSRTIDEALQLANQELTLLFHGGEPLVEFRLIQQITEDAQEAARRRGKRINFQIQTSGAVLNDSIVAFLQDKRFSVGLSLDGPAPINDVIRIMPDGKGSTRLVERQFERYREFFQRQASVLTTVSSVNVAGLNDVVRYFRDKGLRAIDFSLFSEMGRGACESRLAFTAPEYVEAMKRIIAEAEDGALDDIEVSTLTRLLDKLLLPDAHQHCRPSDGPCGAANGVMNVQANGEVTGCDLLRGKDYVLGRIGQDTLDQCIESERGEHTRSRYAGLKQCHQCTWRRACGGTCGASSPGHHELDEMECQAMQLLFEHLAWRLHEDDRLMRYYLKHRQPRDTQEAVSVDHAVA
jgi:uncharacterized protein